jgi:hypothetical protein
MSTRGAYGFRLDGQDKITYNHFDSYPDGLGRALVEWLHAHPPATWRTVAARLRLVTEDTPPTPEDIVRYAPWGDTSVSASAPTEWYALLHDAQGQPAAWDAGLDVMIDDHTFLQDGVFCEWAYVIDLDAGQLEVYIGGTRDPAAQTARYAVTRPNDQGFWACQLLATFPLDALPSPDDFVARCNALEDALTSANDA